MLNVALLSFPRGLSVMGFLGLHWLRCCCQLKRFAYFYDLNVFMPFWEVDVLAVYLVVVSDARVQE